MIWKCDGCDDEREMKGNGTGDWKSADVTLGGFVGYPTCAPTNTVQYRFHLCPDCARRYYRNANPKQWDRLVAAAPDPVITPSTDRGE